MLTLTCDEAEGLVERAMMHLSKRTKKTHKFYLAGFIDALFDSNQIVEILRTDLYLKYVG